MMDSLTDLLNRPLYGGVVVWQAAAGVIVLLGTLKLLRRLLRRPVREHPFMGARTCPACGWRGQVSRFNEVCPRCARPFTA